MSRPLRVAIIDDEPAVRTLVRMLLDHAEGFELVMEAGHLALGIELIEAHDPDVILLDLLLPEVRGTGAVQDVVAAAPEAMVLVLSALRGQDEARRAFEAGAFAYLEKSLLGPSLLVELAELAVLFREHRAGIDVWAGPEAYPRTRS